MSSGKASTDQLDELQKLLVEQMLERLKSGESLTASEWRVIKDLLKDNGIEAIPGSGRVDPLAKEMNEKLPFDVVEGGLKP